MSQVARDMSGLSGTGLEERLFGIYASLCENYHTLSSAYSELMVYLQTMMHAADLRSSGVLRYIGNYCLYPPNVRVIGYTKSAIYYCYHGVTFAYKNTLLFSPETYKAIQRMLTSPSEFVGDSLLHVLDSLKGRRVSDFVIVLTRKNMYGFTSKNKVMGYDILREVVLAMTEALDTIYANPEAAISFLQKIHNEASNSP